MGGKPPALLTSRSMRPNSSMVRWASASSCAASVTSQRTARARRPNATDGLGHGLDLLLGAGGADHVGAQLGEGQCDAAADATAGACHEGDAVGEGEAVEECHGRRHR